MAKALKLFITSFIPQFFQMKDQFFSKTFKASMKMFYVEVILEFLRRSYLVFLPLTIQKVQILNTTIDYILSTKRYNVPLTKF